MSNLAELADLVAYMLRIHQAENDVCTVRFSEYWSDTSPQVQLQAAYGAELVTLAQWAGTLSSEVRLTPTSAHVRAEVTAKVTSPAGTSAVVEVWTVVNWPAALQAAAKLGIALDRDDTTPTFLAPAHVLRVLKAGS